MKWTYSIKNKFLASSALLALCLLVLLSHYLDRTHTEKVTNSITTLYEDRLLAEVYILKMTSTIYQIREVLNSDLNAGSKYSSINELVDGFHAQYNVYLKTKLTTTETGIANELLVYIKNFKQQILSYNYDSLDYTDKALFSLNKLSDVQLEESKLIVKNAESEYVNIKASSQFVSVIIIIILLVLQAIVFSVKTIIPITKPNDATLN